MRKSRSTTGPCGTFWQEGRAILPDSSAEEIRYFFHQRAWSTMASREVARDGPGTWIGTFKLLMLVKVTK
jgi:hypothetical protein